MVATALFLLNKKLSLQLNQSVGLVMFLEFGFSNSLRCIQLTVVCKALGFMSGTILKEFILFFPSH
jgi:hypothetical protein